jgi:uncharacterized protein (TIGR02001 family)
MRNLLVSGFIAAAAAAAPAYAQDVTITGNIALASDYAFRGISQTTEAPAVQGGFDAAFGSTGFYVGTWASNINFPGYGGANMELDVYGGYKFAAGPVAMDVGVLGYFYPGADDDIGGDLDFYEVYFKPSIALSSQFTLGGNISYSPDFQNETGDAWYYEVNGAFVASPELSFSGAVGMQNVDTPGFFGGEDEYTTWNVGGTYSAMGLGFDLRYVGTDVDNVDIYDDRFIFSIKKVL